MSLCFVVMKNGQRFDSTGERETPTPLGMPLKWYRGDIIR